MVNFAIFFIKIILFYFLLISFSIFSFFTLQCLAQIIEIYKIPDGSNFNVAKPKTLSPYLHTSLLTKHSSKCKDSTEYLVFP